jgi:hypothetical protein
MRADGRGNAAKLAIPLGIGGADASARKPSFNDGDALRAKHRRWVGLSGLIAVARTATIGATSPFASVSARTGGHPRRRFPAGDAERRHIVAKRPSRCPRWARSNRSLWQTRDCTSISAYRMIATPDNGGARRSAQQLLTTDPFHEPNDNLRRIVLSGAGKVA